jgi:mono/diheme cytochrome c family protein
VAVHNTLWIVGHFHHMAMLNIGLLIFGATYALLPELCGKALYSEKLAWVHVWTTFVGGMLFFGLWLVQGLDGAPRRWSVLPSQFDSITRISLVVAFVLAAAQALFFWNVLQTLRGKSGVATFDERGIPVPAKSTKEWSVHAAEASLVMVVLLLAAAFAVGGYLVGRESGDGGGGGTTTVETGAGAAVTGNAEDGEAVFADSGCGGCHTLSAAGSTGNVGPSLDVSKPTEALVIDLVTNGKGAMAAFGDTLSEQQIADVAAYVHESAGK